jgi:uncharacterized protein
MKRIWLAISFAVLILGPLTSAEAARYDLKTMTPAVERAITNRQNRYSDLQALKSQGAVGENSRGYVEALSDAAGVQAVVQAENQDRKVIYQTIAEQNNLGSSGFAVIETIFGEVQREKARPGESIQNPTGEWVKK